MFMRWRGVAGAPQANTVLKRAAMIPVDVSAFPAGKERKRGFSLPKFFKVSTGAQPCSPTLLDSFAECGARRWIFLVQTGMSLHSVDPMPPVDHVHPEKFSSMAFASSYI